MDIRRLIEYRESLVNKPDKTLIDYRIINQIDISISALSTNMDKCSNYIIDIMQRKEEVSRNTRSGDLPFQIGNLQLVGFDAVVKEIKKRDITVYDIQTYVDNIRKIDDSNREFITLLRHGLIMYSEQIDRLLDEEHDCELKDLFYCDLEAKKSIVMENRKEILSRLLYHNGQFTFGSLSDDQRESLYTTTDEIVIDKSCETIAKYATLSELETKQYQKVLSRFQIK